MIRMEDAIRAATRRFGDDAKLRDEIARELRTHLEDSFEAARAEGLNEAQAEEKAVRAFGDPEEVGEKLLAANRRRMLWRLGWRAGVQVAALVALIGAVFPLAHWVWERYLWRFNERIATDLLILCAVALLYALSRWFLPKSAFIDRTYLRWLPAAFQRSVVLVVRQPWLWVPILFGTLLTAGHHALWEWNLLDQFGRSVEKLPAVYYASWSVTFHDCLGVQPTAPFGVAAGLLALAYLLFAARVPALLQSETGISRRRARCWSAALTVGAIFTVLYLAFSVYETFRPRAAEQFIIHFPWTEFTIFAFPLPFRALLEAVFFVTVARLVQGSTVSLRDIVQPTYRCIGALIGLQAIPICFLFFPARPLFDALRPFMRPSTLWDLGQVILWMRQGAGFLAAVTAVIVVSDSCRLGTAFPRFGALVWRYFWRNLTFGVLGSVVVVAPSALLRLLFGNSPVSASIYAGFDFIVHALWWGLGAVLTVMWFEFYRTKAGTAEPVVGEAAQETEEA